MRYYAAGGLLEQAEARIAELEEVLRDLVTAVTITPSQWEAARAAIDRAGNDPR